VSAQPANGVVIRPARLGDAEAIAPLLGELGYPTDVGEARRRLRRLLPRGDGGVLVAELNGEAAAVAAYQLVDLLERSRPQCRITTLVVGARHRRRGAGRALLAAVESIAQERGCFRLEVTTQPPRTPARGLYGAVGFEERPLRLVKMLRADDGRGA